MNLIKKLFILLLFIIILTYTGCGSKETAKAKNNEVISITPTYKAKELIVDKDDKTKFLIDNESIKVKDESSSITAITNLEWIDHERIGVTCHVNPSLDYFTIYNTINKKFEYSKYGAWFTWDKQNIKSLIYIDGPAHFETSKNTKYKILDYSGTVIFESNDQLKNLELNSGEIKFNVIDKDGNKIPKTLKLKK